MSRRRILILRPDNIGDVVLFSGAFRHIRNLYPDAHITLAVQAHIVNLVELCPYIDACVAINLLTWWGRIGQRKFPLKFRMEHFIRGLNRLANAIRSPFYTIIYPVKSLQVRHLETIFCLGSRQTFGIAGCSLNVPGSGYPPELHPQMLFTDILDISDSDPWRHELQTSSDFLRFLGCHVTTVDDIRPQLWLSDDEKNYLDGAMQTGRKIIGLFPGSSYGGKCWEPDNYGELAGLLEGGTIYAIFGSLSDVNLTDRVAHSIRERCPDAEIVNLTGLTTLRELARAIMCCDLFIGMDTSGLHMAIAAHIPTIGIAGGGHFGRFVPWGDPEMNVILTHQMDCFHCNWHCGKGGVECIAGVTPEEVAAVARRLLQPDATHEPGIRS